MRLARDTRQTLGLAIEALIELLDAIGPDPDAESSLGAPNGTNQAQSWGYDAGTVDDGEDEHDDREPDEDEQHRYDAESQTSIHAAHEQAKSALCGLLARLRPAKPAARPGASR